MNHRVLITASLILQISVSFPWKKTDAVCASQRLTNVIVKNVEECSGASQLNSSKQSIPNSCQEKRRLNTTTLKKSRRLNIDWLIYEISKVGDKLKPYDVMELDIRKISNGYRIRLCSPVEVKEWITDSATEIKCLKELLGYFYIPTCIIFRKFDNYEREESCIMYPWLKGMYKIEKEGV
ncbi:hypothetical protein ACOME3_001381 [Neoechinorhynchus agilis]